MALEQKITVDASGALTGVQTLNATIASIGDSLGKLNGDLGRTKQAFDSLESKLTSTLRSARDAAISLSRAANEANSSVQKAVSGLASIDSALEKRVARVRELRAELQNLSGTALAGGPTGGGSRGGGRGGAGGGGPGGDDAARGIARLGDFSRFGEQLTRQFAIIAQSRAFFFLKDQIEESASAAKNLSEQITLIQTITQSAGRTTEQWSSSLLKLSNELGRPVGEVAAGTYQALQNNIRGAREDTDALIRTAGNFARLTQTTVPRAVDTLSSTLNSYGLTADRAEEVTAKLFKGIELGRFSGEELNGALGKTAPLASQLGVELDELLASFVGLTVQGNSLNTASTLTLNILNALVKPSEEMKKVFTELGVSSGQALLQQRGLAGVLQLLSERSKGATGELANLFSNIRAQRGIIGLTSDIQRFQQSLGDIRGVNQTFKVALEIEQNSANRSIDTFTTRFKNELIKSTGEAIIAIGALLGRLEQSTGLVGPLTVFGVNGGLVLGLTAIAAKIGTVTAVQNLFLNAAVSTAAVFPRMGDAIATVGNQLGLVVASLTAGYLIGQKIFAQDEARVRLIDNFNKRLADNQALLAKANDKAQVDSFKRIEEAFSSAQRQNSTVRQNVTRQFEDARNAVRTTFEQMSVSLASALDRSRQIISDINRDISRSLNEIDNSRKSLGDFRAGIEKAFLGVKIDLANPQQQLRLLEDEIDRLSNKGKNLIIRGGATPGTQGEELIREGRGDLQEALNLAKQRAEVLKQIFITNTGSVNSTVLLNQLEQDSLRVLNAKTVAERTLQQLKTEEVARLKLQKQEEQERITRLEQNIKLFTELQNKIGSGNINKDKDFFKNGVFDPESVRTKLGDLSKAISAELLKIDPGAAARFSADLAATMTAANNAINASIANSNQERIEKQLIQEREAAKKRNEAILQVNAELQKSLTDSTAQGLANASQLLKDSIGQDFARTFNEELQSRIRGGKGVDPVRQGLEDRLKDVAKLVDSVRATQAGPDGIIQISPENITRLQAASVEVKRFIEATAGLKDLQGSNAAFQTLLEQITRVIDLNASAQGIIQSQQQSATTIFNAQVLGPQSVEAALKSLAETTKVGATQIDASLDVLEGKTSRILQNLIDINNQLNLGGGGGNLPGFSHGGTAFAGQGMDTLLSALRPGEIVMNPGASRMFATQLQAMNNLSSIPYGQGQNVSVGDVNVYVSGSNSSEQTIREIGRGIRREIRRGNLRI